MNSVYIGKDVLNIILEYDGRIKYSNGKYINILHKNDSRYNVVKQVLNKKIQILKTIDLRGSKFYFEFGFDSDERIGLCYDLGFNYSDKFEICYYDFRNGFEQIRTCL